MHHVEFVPASYRSSVIAEKGGVTRNLNTMMPATRFYSLKTKKLLKHLNDETLDLEDEINTSPGRHSKTEALGASRGSSSALSL